MIATLLFESFTLSLEGPRPLIPESTFLRQQMYWYPGGGPGNSTTCLAEGDDWESHRWVCRIWPIDKGPLKADGEVSAE